MRINTNISAMNTYGRLTNANAAKGNSLAKLSSGLRINKAGDDAAGLAISEKMKGQIGGLKQATRNAQDGVSLIQTAEGALNETHAILGRMRDLATQGSNGTLSQDDRAEINKEFDALKEEITRISDTTEFNTKKLLNTKDQEFTFQIGANGGQTMSVKIGKMDSDSLGLKNVQLEDSDTGRLEDVDSKKAVLDDAKKVDLNGLKDTVKTTEVALQQATRQKAAYEAFDDFNNGSDVPDPADQATTKYAEVAAHEGKIDLTDKAALNELFGDTHTLTVDSSYEDVATAMAGLATIDPNAAGGAAEDATDAKEALLNAENDIKNAEEAYSKAVNAQDTAGRTAASDAIATIDAAIKTVSAQRSDLGAAQNRLSHTVKNLTTTQENLSEANSRIRDVDMAEEMMEFTKNNILSQAATSMLSQANAMPNSVLGLLQG